MHLKSFLKFRACYNSFIKYNLFKNSNLGFYVHTNNMSVKPPNILVYTGNNSSKLFKDVESNILKCLQNDRYTIYHLLDSEVLKQPWMENTLLLVITSTFIENTVLSVVETFIKKFGNVLLVCSNFDGTLLGKKCHKASDKENLIQACFKHGLKLSVLKGTNSYDIGGTVLCKDVDKNPLIQKINHDKYALITSEIYLDRDPEISDKHSEYDCSVRISALKYILTEELGLEPKNDDFVPELIAGYYINVSQGEISHNLNQLKLSNVSSEMVVFHECLLTSLDTPVNLPIYFCNRDSFQLLKFDINRYLSKLKTKIFGHHLVCFPVITSTMEIAEQLSEYEGMVVVSDIQIKGRGRRNNKWISPKGCAMFTLHITVSLQSYLGKKLSLLQCIASLAVIHGIRSQPLYKNLELNIKWPNDIYCNKTKIGGLIVTSVLKGDLAHIYIGWGINVENNYPTSCLNGVIDKYNSEHSSSVPHLHVDEVIALTITQMEYFIQDFMERGPEIFFEHYYLYWMHTNQEVTFLNEKGIIVGLDEYGFLKIKKSNGQIAIVQPDGNRFDIMKNLIYAA